MRDAILHLADLHLGAEVQSGLEDEQRRRLVAARNGIFRSLSEWILRDDSPIGLVLIAGDLFDHHAPDERLVSEVRAALEKIARNVPVITVPGNHDELSYSQCVYRQGGWPGTLVETAQPEVIWRGELAGRLCAVVSAAYQAGKVSPGQKLCLPSREDVFRGNDTESLLIGLFHATLADHFRPEVVENERCFWLSHTEAAERGYDYLALGHIHNRQEWTERGCLAHYPGPPLGARVNDPGSGFFWLVLRDHNRCRIERFPSADLVACGWRIVTLEVHPGETKETKEAVDKLADRVERELTQISQADSVAWIDVVQLKGRSLIWDLASRLQNRLREKGLTCLVSEKELDRIVPPDIESLAAEESLIGYFIRQWKAWRDTGQIEEDRSVAVLYEGLLALGWQPSEARERK